MNGGKNRQPLGYTIIEVMIVLAVSGVMFVIAANFINGKQAKTAFFAGVNGFTANLQTSIAQVNDGQYSGIALHCTSGGGPLIISTVAAVGQGENPQCVFLGKVLHFSLHGDTSGTKYEVFSLAGTRNAATLATANATPVTILPSCLPNCPELTVQAVVPQSLQVVSVRITGGVQVYAIGFIQNVDSTNVAANGTQSVNLVYVPTSSPATLVSNMTEAAAAVAMTSHLQTTTSATICLTDGQRFAQILLGGATGASQLSAAAQVVTTCT